MHEVGLVSAAIAQALDVAVSAGAVRVTGLHFAVASGGHIAADAIETLVAALGHGTLVEGAQLDISVVSEHVGQAELALLSVDVDVP